MLMRCPRHAVGGLAVRGLDGPVSPPRRSSTNWATGLEHCELGLTGDVSPGLHTSRSVDIPAQPEAGRGPDASGSRWHLSDAETRRSIDVYISGTRPAATYDRAV